MGIFKKKRYSVQLNQMLSDMITLSLYHIHLSVWKKFI